MPLDAVYLTNTYKKRSEPASDLLVFKIYHLRRRTKSYLLAEVEPRAESFDIVNLMITPRVDRFAAIYRVDLSKNSMGTRCLFAGRDLFRNSFTSQSTSNWRG